MRVRRVLGFRDSEAAPLSPTPAGFLMHAHLALRKDSGKTVMPEGNFQEKIGAEPGETGTTADERQELDRLFSLTYEELRRLASSVKRGDPGLTLSPTALVNEAWLKLAKSPGISATSRMHFKRIAARAMRQLLIEAARRRNARKRGGEGEATFVTFDDSLDGAGTSEGLLVLDAALEELARLEPRQATIVESRFFGGFEMSEIADMIGVSEATVLRDWRAAKAWLGNELRRAR
jgi:RNA polymerase sigma factor (TIGR02999 family)